MKIDNEGEQIISDALVSEAEISINAGKLNTDGDIMWGKYKGVWVGVIKTYGKIATVFPDSEQSDDVRRF